jgi:hypothetical protein
MSKNTLFIKDVFTTFSTLLVLAVEGDPIVWLSELYKDREDIKLSIVTLNDLLVVH